jgi:hypothetical protein
VSWRNVGRMHTVPVDDLAEHSLCADCACGPTIDYPEAGVQHVVHNAFDGRDFDEHDKEARAKVRALNVGG